MKINLRSQTSLMVSNSLGSVAIPLNNVRCQAKDEKVTEDCNVFWKPVNLFSDLLLFKVSLNL